MIGLRVYALLLAAQVLTMTSGCSGRGNGRPDAAPAPAPAPMVAAPPDAGEPQEDVGEASADEQDGETLDGDEEVEAETDVTPASTEVIVHRFLACRDVRRGQPIRPTDRFTRTGGGRIVAFLEASVISGGDKTVAISLESIDSPASSTRPARLTIRAGTRYRTSIALSARRPAGPYEFVARDDLGIEIARTPVRITD